MIVRLFKIEVEYMYSNPTGRYNLSLPERKLRDYINMRAPELNYAQWKRQQTGATSKKNENDDEDDDDDDNDFEDEDEDDFEGLEVRHWNDHSLITEIYKVDVENKGRNQVKVDISIEPEDDEEELNCVLPKTSYFNLLTGAGN